MQDPDRDSYLIPEEETPTEYVPKQSTAESIPVSSSESTPDVHLDFSGTAESAPSNASTPLHSTTFPEKSEEAPGSGSLSAPTKSKRKGLRLLLLIVGVLVFATLSSLASVLIYIAVSKPNSSRLLDAYCENLIKQDYRGAYGLFSTPLQKRIQVQSFADSYSSDHVVSCTHGGTVDTERHVITTLRIVRDSRDIEEWVFLLTRDDNNQWKITSLGLANFPTAE